MPLAETWFGIKQIELRRPARLAQKDDPLHARPMMGRRTDRGGLFTAEQVGKRGETNAHAGGQQPVTTGDKQSRR